MKTLITLFALALSITAFAQKPIYQFSFDDTDNIKFLGERSITIYPVSERMKPILESNLQKKVKAVDHKSGMIIKAKNTDMASQEILKQISEKTGEKVGPIWNSILKKATPTTILMGVSKSTTWFIVISPSPDGDYILTISYLIEEKNG